jgi:hypothetical protein
VLSRVKDRQTRKSASKTTFSALSENVFLYLKSGCKAFHINRIYGVPYGRSIAPVLREMYQFFPFQVDLLRNLKAAGSAGGPCLVRQQREGG